MTKGKYPAVYRQMMALVDMNLEGADDFAAEFRALFTEAMKENITQKVKDGLLGTAETTIHLMPKALAVVAQDLDSPDPLERSRAAQFLLKYAINFKEAEPQNDLKDGVVTIVADRVLAPGQVIYKAPDTEFGNEFLDEVQKTPPSAALMHTSLMGECYRCHEPKAIAAMQLHDRNGDSERYICKSCAWTRNKKSQKVIDVTHEDLVRDY